MRAALKLAHRGLGSVEPNPAVGAVIVKSNQVIGRGWHKEFGGPHAEINALEDCKSLGVNPVGATMYITLEPCCHEGKTSPCTDAIIAAGLAKVVVATHDPSEHAGGKGLDILRNSGIDVQTGVCEKEARLLNAPFMKFAATGKCWVILKWAQSIDGKVAWVGGEGQRRHISNELSRKDVQSLRRRVGAILVGINTVLTDDPLLTARPDKGKQPTRIVLDSHLRIPLDCKLLTTTKKAPVMILTSAEAVQSEPAKREQITEKGAEVLVYPHTGRSNLHFVLDELSSRGVSQLLVEGGPTVISSFLREDLADQVVVYITPKILGGSGSVGISSATAELTDGFDLYHVETTQFGEDIRLSGLTKKALTETSVAEK
jgi:diaminohydroxyphosphoribosylaminopyrimidine deaminase/5-amino-6-(5-phosphoribosylamino)uracil reductase